MERYLPLCYVVLNVQASLLVVGSVNSPQLKLGASQFDRTPNGDRP